MSDNVEVYVSSKTLRGINRQTILAGTQFKADEMVEDTFKVLFAGGSIVLSTVGILPNNPTRNPGYTEAPVGSKAKTQEQIAKDAADVKEKEKQAIRDELAEMGFNYPPDTELGILASKLSEVKQAKTEEIEADKLDDGPKTLAGSVWNMNPYDLKLVPFPQMLAAYKSKCLQYGKTVELFDNRDLLIAKMSSEYVAP